VLQAVTGGMRQDVGELLEMTLAPQSGLHSFNFLGNSIVAAVDSALADAMPSAIILHLPCHQLLLSQ
jgi:hypothetical protein